MKNEDLLVLIKLQSETISNLIQIIFNLQEEVSSLNREDNISVKTSGITSSVDDLFEIVEDMHASLKKLNDESKTVNQG